MNTLSGLLRLVCGTVLIGFAVSRYDSMKPVEGGAAPQLFGREISVSAMHWIVYGSLAIGVFLILLGLLTFFKKKASA